MQIQYLDGANLVIIRGREADVQRVLEIIEEIERITQTSAPKIHVQQLQYVGQRFDANAGQSNLHDHVPGPAWARSASPHSASRTRCC